MSKSQKELAFLRNLYIEIDWTERFTNFFDANFKFSGKEEILYVNAGTGNHAIALREKFKKITELRAVPENSELLKIAQAKADAVKVNVKFLSDFPCEKVDIVLADASFVRPGEITDFLAKIINLSSRQVMFFLPTAGSFGDIFSFLWESLLNADLLEKSPEVERLLTEIPTVSRVEETAQNLGLTDLRTETRSEFFEFESGDAFANSPLVADFLFPEWLDFLDNKARKQVVKKLVQAIDADRGELNFRFWVKMTLISGEKN